MSGKPNVMPSVFGAGNLPGAITGSATPTTPEVPLPVMPFVWPLMFAQSLGSATTSALYRYSEMWANALQAGPSQPPLSWTTPNDIRLELPTMQLRDFHGPQTGQPVLLCAPYSLHGAIITDFAAGHSVVEVLRQSGTARVFVTDWRSATPSMRDYSIDIYLADLNVAVDDVGSPVDLVGLCQGGWLAVLFAARFPQKVRRLVLVGAPIDIRAGPSRLTEIADSLPVSVFESVVRCGDGRVLGKHASSLWGHVPAESEIGNALQEEPAIDEDHRLIALKRRFDEWHARPLDLPGHYYMQVIQDIFKDNQIAEERFMALGRRADLGNIRCPIFLLAASEDEIVHPEQLLSVIHLVGTPGRHIRKKVEHCRHLSLFLGARTIAGAWGDIAAWLGNGLEPVARCE